MSVTGDMLLAMSRQATQDYVERLETENAKLREMLAEDNAELAMTRRVIDYLYYFIKTRGVDAEDMCELRVEVSK